MKKNIWKNGKRPIKVLAPMAGYTDSAFRLLCREMGADLVVTELISADAVAYSRFEVERGESRTIVRSNKNNTTAEMLSFYDAERPLIVQLFGKYPEKFGLAAKWISENLKPDGIDINMGCPARKVVGSDHGAALLKKPTLAVEIVRSVKANTDLPVSVKTRLGWNFDDEILKFTPLLIAAGIDAITIHGRTYKDGFGGQARWENIFKIKEMFGERLVVVGNGDLRSFDESRVKTGMGMALDGMAVGRAAFGNPWIFQEDAERGALDGAYLADNFTKVVLRHAELAFETKGNHGLIEFRKHLLAYLRGFPEAKRLRLLAVKVESLEQVAAILEEVVIKS